MGQKGFLGLNLALYDLNVFFHPHADSFPESLKQCDQIQ